MVHDKWNGRSYRWRGLRIVGWVIFGLLMASLFALVFGYFVMLLWNWLMPELFGFAIITYWQAFGLALLARLLFGGFKHGHKHSHHGHYYGRRFKRKFGMGHYGDKKCHDWKYYHDYWKEEGKAAFDEYVKKKKEEE